MSDYAYHLALLYTERNVFQHRIIRLVAEIYVFKLNIALYIKADGVLGVAYIIILLKYLEYLSCAYSCLCKHSGQACKPLDRTVEHSDIGCELYQLTELHLSAEYHTAAEEQRTELAYAEYITDRRLYHIPEYIGFLYRICPFRRGISVRFYLSVLVAVIFYYPYSVQNIVQKLACTALEAPHSAVSYTYRIERLYRKESRKR